MANFYEAMELLKHLEHRGKKEELLHKNKGELGLTFFGIYQSAHPSWRGWDIINGYLAHTPDIQKCSVILSNVRDLIDLVYKFYKIKFWDIANLDLVNEQRIADEIFIFGTNAGMKVAIKKAQKLVKVAVDGDLGEETLEALNSFDVDKFDVFYDLEEMEHYDTLVALNSRLKINSKGWYYRANYVTNDIYNLDEIVV